MTNTSVLRMGILGCGDFLRIMAPQLQSGSRMRVTHLYDPLPERAEFFARQLGGKAVSTAEAVFADPEVDVVGLFVPPWRRAELWVQAAQAGKHILATKPLAATIADCARINTAAGPGQTGVLYGRSGDRWTVAMRDLLRSGEIGKLALYRQDWLHHYPQWNDWALDPAKNGGPFMDAMIHNLNLARYLMDRPVETGQFFSEKLSHPELPCADTETLRLRFEGNGTALLFITWAADLGVQSTEGNFREHIDIFYLVTDQGWRVTRENGPEGPVIAATRAGEKRTWPAPHLAGSVFDRFAAAVQSGEAIPDDIVSPQMAAEDIRLLRSLEQITA